MPLPDLFAHTLTLHLQPSQPAPQRHAHPLSIWEAIAKGITEHANLQQRVRAVFHCRQPHGMDRMPSAQNPAELEILLFGASDADAMLWRETARRYFDPGHPGRNFQIQAISEPLAQNLILRNTPDLDTPAASEYCLEFLTPFPFQLSPGRPRTWLDAEGFAAALQSRLKKLVGQAVELPPADFRLLPYYWHYRRILHQSKSQRGHSKFLNGCVGPLYLQGEPEHLAQWLPWLQLAENVGIGGQLSFGQGRFCLHTHSPAHFHSQLLNPQTLEKAVRHLLEHDDNVMLELAQHPSGVEPAELAGQLAEQLKAGWQSLPYRAFQIAKPHGGSRVIEIAAVPDRIIQRHLLNLLQAPLEASFADASIGFRHGLSRDDAIAGIRAAMAAGCDHVLKADIADFFASVDLDGLTSQLDRYLPQADHVLRDLLNSVLHMPRRLDGQLQERNRGLATGSPLSPLLANLYLDGFDHTLTEQGIRLIRYADDFILLSQGRETAERLLEQTEQQLAILGLHLQQDKTAIRAIAEGFVFLGIRFDDGEAQTEPGYADNPRKPVYITEPYVMLGVHDDALQISRHHQVLSHIPLNRIGEIHTLAPCLWSTPLLEQAQRYKIPLLVGVGNGKTVVGLGGPSARQYQTSYRQTAKFQAMSETERLALAKRFAVGKLHNYRAWLKQRYQAGDLALHARLDDLEHAMQAADALPALRGAEGLAAQHIFTRIGGWIEADGFVWQGRRRRPADRINALLNFGYHLLFCRLNTLVRGAGLNPYLGFLHQPNSRYEALVCDLQELFRPHVDRTLLRLLNRGMIAYADFNDTERGCYLKPAARKCFLAEFAREFEQSPAKAERASVQEAMALQVHFLQAFFLQDRDFPLYQWGKTDLGNG